MISLNAIKKHLNTESSKMVKKYHALEEYIDGLVEEHHVDSISKLNPSMLSKDARIAYFRKITSFITKDLKQYDFETINRFHDQCDYFDRYILKQLKEGVLTIDMLIDSYSTKSKYSMNLNLNILQKVFSRDFPLSIGYIISMFEDIPNGLEKLMFYILPVNKPFEMTTKNYPLVNLIVFGYSAALKIVLEYVFDAVDYDKMEEVTDVQSILSYITPLDVIETDPTLMFGVIEEDGSYVVHKYPDGVIDSDVIDYMVLAPVGNFNGLFFTIMLSSDFSSVYEYVKEFITRILFVDFYNEQGKATSCILNELMKFGNHLMIKMLWDYRFDKSSPFHDITFFDPIRNKEESIRIHDDYIYGYESVIYDAIQHAIFYLHELAIDRFLECLTKDGIITSVVSLRLTGREDKSLLRTIANKPSRPEFDNKHRYAVARIIKLLRKYSDPNAFKNEITTVLNTLTMRKWVVNALHDVRKDMRR